MSVRKHRLVARGEKVDEEDKAPVRDRNARLATYSGKRRISSDGESDDEVDMEETDGHRPGPRDPLASIRCKPDKGLEEAEEKKIEHSHSQSDESAIGKTEISGKQEISNSKQSADTAKVWYEEPWDASPLQIPAYIGQEVLDRFRTANGLKQRADAKADPENHLDLAPVELKKPENMEVDSDGDIEMAPTSKVKQYMRPLVLPPAMKPEKEIANLNGDESDSPFPMKKAMKRIKQIEEMMDAGDHDQILATQMAELEEELIE